MQWRLLVYIVLVLLPSYLRFIIISGLLGCDYTICFLFINDLLSLSKYDLSAAEFVCVHQL